MKSTLPTNTELGIHKRLPLIHLWNLWDSPTEGFEMMRDELEIDDETWEQYAEVLTDKIEELVVDGEMMFEVENRTSKLTELQGAARYVLTWRSEEADVLCWIALSSRATAADIKWLQSIFEF